MEMAGTGGPAFKMMMESFLEHAKTQGDELIEGAIFLFIPEGGNASTASLLSWVPVNLGKDPAVVWQEGFIAMVWTLMSAGLTEENIHQHISYAAQFHEDLQFEQQHVGDESDNEVEN